LLVDTGQRRATAARGVRRVSEVSTVRGDAAGVVLGFLRN
jgi:hypothetical protein